MFKRVIFYLPDQNGTFMQQFAVKWKMEQFSHFFPKYIKYLELYKGTLGVIEH